MGLIYQVTNLVSGKTYVGQTIGSLEIRWSQHIATSKKKKGHILAQAIRKYGPENFSIKILEDDIPIEQLNEHETFWIAKLNPEYNLLTVGENGRVHSQLTKEKISASITGELNPMYGTSRVGKDNPNYGKRWTDEQKKAQSERLKGTRNRLGSVVSEETKKKISDSLSGRPGHNKGKKFDKEFGEKISAAKKGSEVERLRNTYIITFPDGHEEEVIGLVEFGKREGLKGVGNLSSVANGKLKHYKGYKARKIRGVNNGGGRNKKNG